MEKDMEPIILPVDDEIIKDEKFTYDGYQVVRGEFFAHIHEPSIIFNNSKVSFNTACVNKLPDVDYVQILVNSEELKLAVRSCGENAKDSFLWCGINKKNGRKKPRQITCRVFFAKLVQLANWNHDCRYKIMGKLIESNGEYLFIFDLTAKECYQPTHIDGEKSKLSRTPLFPAEWQNQFGLTFEEHRKSLQVNIFDGYFVFGMKEEEKPTLPILSDYNTIEGEDNENE